MPEKKINNITAVILAGGKNTRYKGETKALLEIEGISIYKKTTDLLGKIFKNIIIITNTPEFFPNDGFDKYCDVIKNIGPIGGIHSALSHVKNQEAIFVTASDMPFLSETIIRNIINNFIILKPDILIPRVNSLIQPLNAIYKTNIFSKLDYFIKDSNNHAIRNFFDKVDVKYINFDNNSEITKAFMNINTPKEFELIKNKNYF